MDNGKNILDLIPQKPPFVMVSELLSSDDNTTRSGFVVTRENIFTIDNKFTEAGLMENMAQTAALHAGYHAQQDGLAVEVGYIAAVTNFEVFSLPETGDELVTEIKMESKVFDVSMLTGKAWCRDMLLAQCEMRVFKA